MQTVQKPLEALKETMERLEKTLKPAGIVRKVTTRITWPLWGKDDIREGLDTIERSKSLLILWLGKDIWLVQIHAWPRALLIYSDQGLDPRSGSPRQDGESDFEPLDLFPLR
jgi:hypothetical protein